MIKYFVVFHTENDGGLPRNDVIEHHQEISDHRDIRDIENKLAFDWFGEDRAITITNFKEI